MRFCTEAFGFHQIKLLTSLPCESAWVVPIPPIRSIEAYSEFVVYDLHKHVETTHCLIVQHDGWVCAPDQWQDEWLRYDYLGGVAGWSESGPDGKGGNGGFSLRSKRLLEAGSRLIPRDHFHPEDCAYSSTLRDSRWGFRDLLENEGMIFAPRRVQESFCTETAVWSGQFGHHKCDLRQWSPGSASAQRSVTVSDIIEGGQYKLSNDHEVLWVLTLGAHGVIEGPHHDNETYWRVCSGRLELLDKQGNPSSVFTAGPGGTFQGLFRHTVPHYLEQWTTPVSIPQREHMHPTQFGYVRDLVRRHMAKVPRVWDIGGFDVNGTHRPIFDQLGIKYRGVDLHPGPNVDDVVAGPYDWAPLPESGCEALVSGSCLEHVEAPWLWALEAERRLAPGGILIVILPFVHPEHRYPVDCYRILPDGLDYLFCKHAKLIKIESGITANGTDSYFVGKKA
jgi:SAM-dependent methyltransferase